MSLLICVEIEESNENEICGIYYFSGASVLVKHCSVDNNFKGVFLKITHKFSKIKSLWTPLEPYLCKETVARQWKGKSSRVTGETV